MTAGACNPLMAISKLPVEQFLIQGAFVPDSEGRSGDIKSPFVDDNGLLDGPDEIPFMCFPPLIGICIMEPVGDSFI